MMYQNATYGPEGEGFGASPFQARGRQYFIEAPDGCGERLGNVDLHDQRPVGSGREDSTSFPPLVLR